MTKFRRALIALIVALLTLGQPGLTAAAPSPPRAKYTVMVFLNGSDLESGSGAATDDLQEMMAVGSNPDVNVVVETLGTNEWKTEGISNTHNQRWLVQKDKLQLVDDSQGLKPVADPDTLRDFITWAVQKYPADRYGLIFWNHGGGSVAGYGVDELATDGPQSLTLAGIQKGIGDALRATGTRFEFVGFDTCLLATVEMASLLSPFSHYLVASEETEPGHGWFYTPVLEALTANPTITGDKLGQIIADGFAAQATEWGDRDEITLSVTDLTKVAPVVTALEGFVRAVGSALQAPDRLQVIAQARSKAEDYGNAHGQHTDMVDLGDLARNAAAAYPQESKALLNALSSAVLYKVTSKGKPNGSGLSVWLPFKDRNPDLDTYATVPFSDTYKQFVASWAQALFADNQPVQFVDKPEAESEEDGRTLFRVRVKPQDENQVAEAYSVIAQAKPGSDQILFLGMDNDVEYDPATGELSDGFDGATVTLNGHFVSMFFEDEAEDTATYTIPVKLNGRSVDLVVLYSFKTNDAEVIGAWPGFDGASHMASRDLIKVKPGDRITPVFYYYDSKTGKDGYEDGSEFVVQGPLQLGLTDLPPGDYLHGFYVVDYAGNEAFTDFETITIDPVPKEIRVFVGGKRLVFDVPPEVRNDRTLVPLRTIFEALGAKVSWNGETRTVTATRGDITIQLQIDNPVAQVNGKPVKLDQAPVISGGRTLVPVRFVGEALGARVTWDPATRTVKIDPQP